MERTVDAKSNFRRRSDHQTRMVAEMGHMITYRRFEHVIQTYDTAFMKKETADYSAITTWGVFQKRPRLVDLLIEYLLDAVKETI
jgi:phage terminase large subunit-like protein